MLQLVNNSEIICYTVEPQTLQNAVAGEARCLFVLPDFVVRIVVAVAIGFGGKVVVVAICFGDPIVARRLLFDAIFVGVPLVEEGFIGIAFGGAISRGRSFI